MLWLWRLLWREATPGKQTSNEHALPITTRLEANIEYLKKTFGRSEDLVIREIELPGNKLALVYLETLIDRDVVQRDILRSLLALQAIPLPGDKARFSRLIRARLTIGDLQEERLWSKIITGLLDGKAVLMVEGYSRCLLLSIEGWEKRPVEEPVNEVSIRGPREGFAENLATNISLIRRRLRAPELRFEAMNLGRRTHTKVVICYLEGLVLKGILEELRRRLQRIDIDGILESGYIEELIEDAPNSPFPQLNRTERPDKLVADLLEGRIAVLTDGTPFALILPGSLISQLHAPDDYYERWPLTIGIRLFRFLGIFIALLLPSLYVALTTFHQEMIPTPLAISIAAQRELVPYPAVVEALIMQVLFEILIEAGIRLPRAIGTAISIVGALVIGEAAVRAGLMSAAMVIVIAATAIASFTIPTFGLSQAVRMLRLPMILLAGFLGLLGIFAGLLVILIHLVSLRSFGEPYLSPLAPFIWEAQKDLVVRVPWWAMLWRPVLTGWRDLWRIKPGLHPFITSRDKNAQDELETQLGEGNGKSVPARKGKKKTGKLARKR
ncbi:spore germination protein [Neomoorella mulderi]|uniref:Spore germination protein B1 n=1 Tax=Moorella mulderi DSM 14980 TaxID=1122241 RepID=A0A151AZH0_9FIRM|nr:spore germination protein [Moorella mulderi]KYH32942.1 spore germination protein B1 [Moorella mulderi DSM 14980]